MYIIFMSVLGPMYMYIDVGIFLNLLNLQTYIQEALHEHTTSGEILHFVPLRLISYQR